MSVAVAGSLLPDIDQPGSKVTNKSWKSLQFSAGVNAVAGHRGFTHTPLFCLLVTVLCAITVPLNLPYAFEICEGLLIGTLSHLVLDAFNPGGIMWLYPFSKRHCHLARIRMRSSGEVLFAAALVALAVLLAVQFNGDVFARLRQFMAANSSIHLPTF